MNDTIAPVRDYWEEAPPGTAEQYIGSDTEPLSREWFAKIEARRYRMQPYIHSLAQFPLAAHKSVLEIGVGAGTDHLQFARSGARLFGVDLTWTAVATTRAHLSVHGLRSELAQVADERLPFAQSSFDLVYSFGVIHHTPDPPALVSEIHRVLRPGGCFRGMVYHSVSVSVLKKWVQHALRKGRPWRSPAHVLSRFVESEGTRAYSGRGVRRLFQPFSDVDATPQITPYDVRSSALRQWVPSAFGWNWMVVATRASGGPARSFDQGGTLR